MTTNRHLLQFHDIKTLTTRNSQIPVIEEYLRNVTILIQILHLQSINVDLNGVKP